MKQKITFNLNTRMYIHVFMITLTILHSLVLHYVLSLVAWLAVLDGVFTYGAIYLIAIALHIYWQDKYNKYTQIFIIIIQSIFVTVAWVYLSTWMVDYIARDIAVYIDFWHNSMFVRSVIVWIVLCNLLVIFYLSHSLSDEADKQERISYNEQLKKDAELLHLRQQINPHFLFNTLNSVNALITIAPDKAQKMIEQMSIYFRHSLKKENNQWTTIQDELNDIRLYLDIEKVRFGHRLHIEETIMEQVLEKKIPPFLLQPLIENAIKYGLYGTIGAVFLQLKVAIKTIQSQSYIDIVVINNYDKSVVQPKGTGFGLEYIKRRLYLLFARNDLLKTTITPLSTSQDNASDATFEANIMIPLK